MTSAVSDFLQSNDASGEFTFRDADFERIRSMIYERAGISLSPAKRSMVYSRLVRRLRALGETKFSSYLATLDDPRHPEWEHFVNALTTNLTSFYREAHHFKILADHLARQPRGTRLRIWCCAASTGEEPYTIAFTAIEAFGSATPPVEIVATDIDTQVLERAARGIYPEEAIEKIDSARVARFFKKGVGANAGMVRIKPEVQRLITFRQLNLLEPQWPVGSDFCAIFCRNVMIYFDKKTQHALLGRFVPLLNDDGLLFAGHSENFAHARELFQACGQTVYRPARSSQRKD